MPWINLRHNKLLGKRRNLFIIAKAMDEKVKYFYM